MRGTEEDSEAGSPSSESPLRQALGGGGGCTKSPSSSSSTPILSASLSAPPMLSRYREEEEEDARRNGLYKHLISQLTGPPKRHRGSLSPARFQCPVCRKRFQRHIALNAHFQSEHIGEEPGSRDKSCKICQSRLSSPGDPSAIRLHLLSAHRIDLENPAACLIPEDKFRLSPDEEVGSSSSNSSISSLSERLFPGSEEGGLLLEGKNSSKDLIASSSSSRSVKKRRKATRALKGSSDEVASNNGPPWTCMHCAIIFPNQTLYFLHKGFHGDPSEPFRCNGCGMACSDMYDFNTHLMSDPHH